MATAVCAMPQNGVKAGLELEAMADDNGYAHHRCHRGTLPASIAVTNGCCVAPRRRDVPWEAPQRLLRLPGRLRRLVLRLCRGHERVLLRSWPPSWQGGGHPHRALLR